MLWDELELILCLVMDALDAMMSYGFKPLRIDFAVLDVGLRRVM